MARRRNGLEKLNRKLVKYVTWRFAITMWVVVAIVFNSLIIPLRIKSNSMNPTLQSNFQVIYSPSLVRFDSSLKRGSLIVITPKFFLSSLSTLRKIFQALVRIITFNIVDISNKRNSSHHNQYMIRRLVGLPGDTVKVENFKALIKTKDSNYFISEFELAKPSKYLLNIDESSQGWPSVFPQTGNYSEVLLKENEYFVLADNRTAANDSQDWGPIGRDRILGVVLFNYWPPKYLGKP